jgi:RimJ/RimL family protein N-acetyltransferase
VPADLDFVREVVARMPGDHFSWTEALDEIGTRYIAPAATVTLVPALSEHCAFFLACRSDADSVRWSRTGRAITVEEHKAWYPKAMDNPGVRLRVAMVDGEPVGTVRVDLQGGVGDVGIALAIESRGKGLGRKVLQAMIADCAADPQVVSLTASVHAENTASLRVFGAVGFATDGESDGFRSLRRPVHPPI